MRKMRGQSILEYAVIMVVILGCLIAMQNYIRRGIQGRWKSAVDDFGEQYDPRSINSNIIYSTEGNSESRIETTPTSQMVGGTKVLGRAMMRNDYSNTVENKTGNAQVGA